MGMLGLGLGADFQYGEVVGQQFFEHQTALGRVLTLIELIQGHGGRGAVQQLEGGSQLDLLGVETGGQQLLHPVLVEQQQRLIREVAQGELAQPLRGGVDGGEGRLGLAGLLLAEQLVLGVGHLQAELAGAGLAEAADQPPLGQAVFLGRGEIEEPQGEGTCAVTDAAHQHAAAAHHQLGILDLPFDGAMETRHQVADGPHLGAILVAVGQVEQQVLHGGEPEPLELLLHLAADTLQAIERDFIQFHQSDACDHCKYVQMIGSIEVSTQAALTG